MVIEVIGMTVFVVIMVGIIWASYFITGKGGTY